MTAIRPTPAAREGHGVPGAEPPVYRPFALLALAATLLGGTPLGLWMLARLYWGGGPVAPEWGWLHAHLQIFGFFGSLILGVAHHLVPRFAGRPLDVAGATWLFRGIAVALGLRVGATLAGVPAGLAAAAALETVVFVAFGSWVWRGLDGVGLAATRWRLGVATGWLASGVGLEAVARATGPDLVPAAAAMRAAHAAALYGGVTGWVLAVMLRAGPMFVPRWRIPAGLARAVPWLPGLGVAAAVVAELPGWEPFTEVAVARAGEAVVLATVAAVALAGGVLRPTRGAVLMVGHAGPEAWLLRLAMVSAGAAAAGSAGAAGLAWSGVPLGLLADALRHLVTVGFLTAMAVGMAFRLLPVLAGVPLPRPRLRAVALGALTGAVVLRTAEVLADYLWAGILAWLPLSGVLVWLALGCVAANLFAARAGRPPD